MISIVEGTLVERRPTHVIVSCGGVGYDIAIPLSTFDKLPPEGESCRVLTRLIVREDAHLLFGFATDEERRIFDLLLSVSRVGPKLALAVLSGMSIAEVRRAIGTEDTGMLASVPGVGKRTAERICVELKDKIGGGAAEFGAISGAPAGDGVVNEAVAALVVLGYSRNEAQDAVARAVRHAPDVHSTEELIRGALGARQR
ncbi:MAG TPA: Holliday junction branch migration protein RuvA [Acidobacteriota bacterium]|nr:Holliday junction branch migration protein RuvA [Acidobacteriota bacterium]